MIDEDLSLLGEKGEEMRKLYVEMKKGAKVVKKKKKIVMKAKKVVENPPKVEEKPKKKKKIIKKKKSEVQVHKVNESELEMVEWSRFQNVEVLEAGVCGLKVCCIRVEFEGKNYILKEMRESFRYGRDYMLMDMLKKKFGVKDMGMRRIRSNMGLERVDFKRKSFVGNWKWGERSLVYCMMDEFVNRGDLGKNKEFLVRDDVFRDSLKIRLFDGLFRSSDNIMRNILINDEGVVLSIDEGDIYGKRPKIFGKTDWFLKKENL